MINNFLAYIKEQKLFNAGDKILLAVSGGADSSVLCHLFGEAGFNFAIAHCNFGLRGEESEKDALFVRDLASFYRVPFFVQKFDVKTLVEKDHISVQMAARKLRYEWFDFLLEKLAYDYVATAHQKSDNLETVLLNMTRGTGIAGLHGIAPLKGRVIRPMLFVDKTSVLSYAKDKNLNWREDSSNKSLKYKRNFIRHEVVPLLKKLNPEVESRIDEMVEKVAAVENVFLESVRGFEKVAVTTKGTDIYIDKKKVLELAEPEIVLFEILKGYHFNYVQVKEIVKHLSGHPAGSLFFSGLFELVVDREALIISPKGEEEGQVLSQALEVFEVDTDIHYEDTSIEIQKELVEIGITKDKNVAYLDYSLLKFPLKIRSWKRGDWFRPLGMKGKKLLSDFMIDAKIPLNLKKRVKLLVSGEDIIWVIGHRIDDRYKVTSKTTVVYKLIKK